VRRLQDGFGAFDLVRRRPRLEAWWSRAAASASGVEARAKIDKAIAKTLGEV